jgi:hypothetical protein
VLPWRDVLHEGRLSAGSAAGQREGRAAFLAGRGWGSRETILRELERRDALLGAALVSRRPVVLWFEHDLYDQLQVLQVLAAIAASGVDSPAVELLVVGEVAGRPDFRGLGELGGPELEALWPLRVPLTADIAGAGRAGWEAVCAPDPLPIESFARAGAVGIPYLPAALGRLLEELPHLGSGLSRTERQLLEAIAEGTDTPIAAFLANGRREQAPFAGDAWIWLRLCELGTGDEPLVEWPSGEPLPPPARGMDEAFEAFGHRPLRLTSSGRAVLAGVLDRIDVLGIDRWLGGTHLRPGKVWRWDPARGRVVGPSG